MASPAQASPEAFLAMGRQVLASQPFSALIGAEMHALSPGLVDLQLPITDKVKQQDGLVHGGVVSYLADNAVFAVNGGSEKLCAIAQGTISRLPPDENAQGQPSPDTKNV